MGKQYKKYLNCQRLSPPIAVAPMPSIKDFDDAVNTARGYYDRYGNYHRSSWDRYRWLLWLLVLIPLFFILWGIIRRQRSGKVVTLNQGFWRPGHNQAQPQYNNNQQYNNQAQYDNLYSQPAPAYNNQGDYSAGYQEGYQSYTQGRADGHKAYDNDIHPPAGPPPDDYYAPPPGPPPAATKS